MTQETQTDLVFSSLSIFLYFDFEFVKIHDFFRVRFHSDGYPFFTLGYIGTA